MALYKRNGYYIFQLYINGKVYRTKTIKISIKRKAEKVAKKLEEEWTMEYYLNGQKKHNEMSLKKLAKKFFKEKHFNSKRTKRMYERAVEQYKNNKEGNFVWRHLKAIYNWGIKKEYVSKNPFDDKPTQSKPSVKYYKDAFVKNLLSELKKDREGDIVRFAFYTGARLGELANLNPDAVNDNNIVLNGKTGKRPFPINRQVEKLINRGNIFDFETTRQVEYIMEKNNINATKIRHTFATRLVKNGMPLFRVSKLMGHKSVTTTEKYYAHLKPSDIDDVSDKLGY